MLHAVCPQSSDAVRNGLLRPTFTIIAMIARAVTRAELAPRLRFLLSRQLPMDMDASSRLWEAIARRMF
jgi:hypothetical protein